MGSNPTSGSLVRIAAVRLRPLILPAAVLGVLGVLLLPALAQAQESIDPTATPTEFTGGWVYAMAVGMTVLGALIAVLVVVSYMRFAPRFQKGDQHTVRAERIVEGREPPRRQVEVRESEPVLVAAPVAQVAAPVATAPPQAAAPPLAAPPAAAPKPVPAPAAVTAQKPAEQAAAAPAVESKPVEGAPAEAAPPAAASHGGAEQDQETYDRVLAEQLSKGVDRRVAEGRAKSAAVVAARKKAGG